MTKKHPKEAQGRFLFVDGLRGIAAMMVVLFHFQLNLRPAVQEWFPPLIDELLRWGNLGVDIFFVLSGFVIMHSVRKGSFSGEYLARFALRRSIRLDPPLWFIIVLELLLIRLGLALFPSLGTPVPGWEQVLANLTYTQRFLRQGDVVDVFWSLTYEVQFYLVLVLALVLYAKVVNRTVGKTAGLLPALAALTVPHFYSLLIYMDVLSLPLYGLFVDRWFQFSLGVLAWACFRRVLPVWSFVFVALVTVCLALAVAPSPYRSLSTLSAVATASALLVVGRRAAMHRLFAGRVSQFLGRISYSLYLVHLLVGWRFITLVKMTMGPELGVIMATFALIGGVGLSILVSWLMFLALEAPSVRLARRVKLPVR